jgi:hypothetical protein
LYESGILDFSAFIVTQVSDTARLPLQQALQTTLPKFEASQVDELVVSMSQRVPNPSADAWIRTLAFKSRDKIRAGTDKVAAQGIVAASTVEAYTIEALRWFIASTQRGEVQDLEYFLSPNTLPGYVSALDELLRLYRISETRAMLGWNSVATTT